MDCKLIVKSVMWVLLTLEIICIYLCLTIGILFYFEWKMYEWTQERIERITGVEIPECEFGPMSNMHIDLYDDCRAYSLSFKSVPQKCTFDEIDRKIAAGCKEWVRDGDKYTYSVTWGQNYSTPTPKGERDAKYATFSLEITRGSKNGRIEYIYDSIK